MKAYKSIIINDCKFEVTYKTKNTMWMHSSANQYQGQFS